MSNHEPFPLSHPDMLGEARLAPETQHVFDEIAVLDPELLESPETRRLLEIGAASIHEVTKNHGSPDAPRWYQGTVDQTIMTYHNGESEVAHGHTSIGANGVGVPRNVLQIALQINARAGREVVGPFQRTLLFTAATTHDLVQLCGRSIAVANGDEEQSARRLYDMLQIAGFSKAVAQEGAIYDMATVYDPARGAHVIVTDGQPPHIVLGQQIMAGGDLLSPATERGALGSMEWTLEEFGLNAKGRVLQAELAAQGLSNENIPDLATLQAFVDATPALKQRFAATLLGQAGWIESLSYSDSAIRLACGAGIDDMFPGRPRTAANLRALAELAQAGAPLHELWAMAGAR